MSKPLRNLITFAITTLKNIKYKLTNHFKIYASAPSSRRYTGHLP
ncbi:hypothetical protein PREVCOP_06319 [Segatella copri DSM 18205]|uniref:Uncharacterized protein n=1 Tax=Segatella copri DSM 18205 TaxID=537011 RepID=D1PGF3_9BACT|nr:hypothetical protein PREVCOP_06319 [Segatella copri DSM 18205]